MSESEFIPIDQKTNLETPIILEPFEKKDIEIYCSPKNNFQIKIFSQEGTFDLNITTNDFNENNCYFGNGSDGNIILNSIKNINSDILNLNRTHPDE
jgi:hypothetical protein